MQLSQSAHCVPSGVLKGTHCVCVCVRVCVGAFGCMSTCVRICLKSLKLPSPLS